MKKMLIFVAMFLQGCTASYPVDTHLQSRVEAKNATADAVRGPSAESCAKLLAAAVQPGDQEKLSSFDLFNEDSLSAATPDPADITIPVENEPLISTACLPLDYFNFAKLVEGELVAGTNE